MKKGKTERIDFGGVEGEPGRRRRVRIPEGDYLCKILKHEKKRKEGGSSYYFNWHLQVVEDAQGKEKHKGTPLYYITSLKPEALFNLRNFIFAASDGKKNVTGKTVNFDPKTLYGKQVGVTVEDDEYEGKMRSRAVDVMPPNMIEAADEEDEEEDEDEDEEEEEDEDEEEEDEDELDDVDLDEDM
jgi:hypothetical protein